MYKYVHGWIDIEDVTPLTEIPGLRNWSFERYGQGNFYSDPSLETDAPDIERLVTATLSQLEVEYRELGRGLRGAVFDAGVYAVKKFFAHKRSGVSGLRAANANSLLHTALGRDTYMVGPYALAGCMPRGVYIPDEITDHPTWIMDTLVGCAAQEILNPPVEATELYAGLRDETCKLALATEGVIPDSVFFDTTCSNVLVNSQNRRLFIIDVMAVDATNNSFNAS